MDKNKVIGGIVAVVLLAGIFYFVSQRPSSEVASNRSTAESQDQASDTSSLKALFARGDSQECTYSDSGEGYSSNGTVYVASNNRMRSDFTSTSEGETTTGHMIVMDNTSYIWTDGDAQGIKMSYDPNDIETDYQNTETSAPTQGMDPNENYDFSCKSWRTDNSKFELPSGVEFMKWSMPEVPAMPNGGVSGAMPSSDVCNQLPEPGKTECLKALDGSGLEAR